MQRKKIALFGVFGLGSFSVAGMSLPFSMPERESDTNEAGCVRYDYVRMLSSSRDQSYYLADSLNWCGIEIYVGKRSNRVIPVYFLLTPVQPYFAVRHHPCRY